ncbi:hypothetical protein Cgig2_016006 [Carnegiea gigantea]|uniref:glucan endo-1,3-beta-D-glucosidase n=1 Tax=Carnegiea gigantea TaxID=171969 RepID=A0A9Q1QN66_9CARY|nr:hypothetical protein Cgig2_016006 [Carnegiea gigantea]
MKPDLPANFACGGFEAYGFGLDPPTKDYKVVVIKGYRTRTDEDDSYHPPSVLVYSLRTDSWKYWGDLQHEYIVKNDGSYIFVTGCLYWLGLRTLPGDDKREMMISFSIALDSLQEIPVPMPSYDERACTSLGIHHDSVALYAVHPCHDNENENKKCFDIWTLTEGIFAGSWNPNFNSNKQTRKPLLSFVFLLLITPASRVESNIGVNYGTNADNLPPPDQVAKFLLDSTIINRVRLFDSDPDMIRAFAYTGISVTVTVPDVQIPRLTNLTFAQEWVKAYISPHVRSTNIIRILVGNEVLSTASKPLIVSLVSAMETLHAALVEESLDRKIQISTPHSLGILSNSDPPSLGRFRQGYDVYVLKPLLNFLRAIDSPFMVNPYPFFGTSNDTLNYALFRPNPGVLDNNTNVNYTNMLDAQLDAVFSAMKILGYDDVDIVIAETGWPSSGDPGQVGVDPQSAATYNANLVRHVTSGVGTPLMPNRIFETYIFELFDEDLKPGPTYEQHFGLFGPDLAPVYEIGIMRPNNASKFAPRSTTCSLITMLVCWLLVV